jgi:hypothetical protein
MPRKRYRGTKIGLAGVALALGSTALMDVLAPPVLFATSRSAGP